MSSIVYIALFGWIPVVLGLFMVLPPRRAVIAAFLGAWLFLPMAGFSILFLPDYTKMSATTLGVLLGAAIFDAERLHQFRARWFDIPAFAFVVVSPFMSSMVNQLGIYDAITSVVDHMITWGLPYFIGRVYFQTLDDLRELAVGIVIAGLIYMPLVLFEARMSPHLHKWVYGYFQHSFAQQKRLGGFRPMVFMQHGLMVGIWMAMVALASAWLARSGTVRYIAGVPAALWALALLFTAVVCRSSYAMLLLLVGLLALFLTPVIRSRVLLAGLVLLPPVYITLRVTNTIDATAIVDVARDWFGEDRANSVAFRVVEEHALSAKALERPLWGWGGWGRGRTEGAVTDSLWIIILGDYGLIGLFGVMGMILLPVILVMYDYRPELWTHPRVGAAVALAGMLVIYMLDHLMNAMLNPILMVAAGALGSAHAWAAEQRELAARQAALAGGAPAASAPRVGPVAGGIRGGVGAAAR